jgi:hypothetical protein
MDNNQSQLITIHYKWLLINYMVEKEIPQEELTLYQEWEQQERIEIIEGNAKRRKDPKQLFIGLN